LVGKERRVVGKSLNVVVNFYAKKTYVMVVIIDLIVAMTTCKILMTLIVATDSSSLLTDEANGLA